MTSIKNVGIDAKKQKDLGIERGSRSGRGESGVPHLSRTQCE